MSLKKNIIYLYFKGKHLITSKSQYQYNHGQYLYFADLNLPQAFEVHFSNKNRGESKTQIGSNKLVEIPDEYFWSGALEIYAWVYLHDGTDDGETIYEVKIPLIKRAKPTDEEPLPVQQSAIDKAIAELNNAVDITNENADKTNADKTQVAAIKEEIVTLKEEIDSTASAVSQDAQSARESADASEQSAQNSAESERKALDYSDEAKGYAQSALESKNTASQKAQVATDASAEAKGYRDEAETFKNEAEQAKQNIVDYRNETKGYRDEALTAKDDVQTIKGDVQSLKTQIDKTATDVAINASDAKSSADLSYRSAISADNASLSASQSADEASDFADSASQSAGQAEQFKNQSATNVTHYPKVVDGFWYVWDANKNEYVNTNVDARGIKGDKGDIGKTGNGIENTVLNSDYTLTITFTDGTSYTTPSIRGEKGIKGDVGNGIASTVLNNDYTLTINFTDGTQYTTPPIRGKQGDKGDQGETGESGVYVGDEAPTDESIDVWIDTDGSADSGTVEDLIEDVTELKSALNELDGRVEDLEEGSGDTPTEPASEVELAFDQQSSPYVINAFDGSTQIEFNKIRIAKKNLFDVSKIITQGNVTNNDGVISGTGNNLEWYTGLNGGNLSPSQISTAMDRLPFLKAGDYVFSASNPAERSGFVVIWTVADDGTRTLLSRISCPANRSVSAGFTIAEDTVVDISFSGAWFTLTDIQIEKGDTATSFEAFSGCYAHIPFGVNVSSGTLTVTEDGTTTLDSDGVSYDLADTNLLVNSGNYTLCALHGLVSIIMPFDVKGYVDASINELHATVQTEIANNKQPFVRLNVMTYNVGRYSWGTTQDPGMTEEQYQQYIIPWKRFIAQSSADILVTTEAEQYMDKGRTHPSSDLFSMFGNNAINWGYQNLYSKYTMRNTGTGNLSTGRPYTYGYITVNNKEIFVLAVHLKNGAASIHYDTRTTEYTEIVSLVSDKEYYIVLGDFNCQTYDVSEFANFIGAISCNGGVCGRYWTYSGNATDYENYDEATGQALDNIFVSQNIVVESCKAINVYSQLSSDHLPFTASLLIY